MADNNPILTSGNLQLPVTNLYGGTPDTAPNGYRTLHGLPLGTANTTGTGELGVKCIVIAGGSTPVVSTVTQTSAIVGPGSGTIPSGSKGWGIAVISGTVTFNGAAGLGVGFSDSDEQVLAAAIPYTVNASSSMYVRYGT